MIELYTKLGSQVLQRPDPFFKFPAGEWDIKNDGKTYIGDEIVYISGTELSDYVKGMLWANAQTGTSTAIIPYLPAARGDKGVVKGAEVYSLLIPYTDKLIVVDAHSNFMVDNLYHQNGVHPRNVTAKEIFESQNITGLWGGVIAPDKGAAKRAKEVADYLGVDLFQAEKVRDPDTGKLSGFTCETLSYGDRYLIVDDICDGGGTFLGLAEWLWDQGYTTKHNLDLYVTHGIFSKGFGSLEKYFKKIYTTDTIFDRDTHSRWWEEPKNLEVIEIKEYLLTLI